MKRLDSVEYMSFPFCITDTGAARSKRSGHIREQIEQVLFTSPRERLFRPEFGAGINRLLFEPNSTGIWELTQKRLYASLAEALKGEVDPKTLDVRVEGKEAEILIIVEYTLAALNHPQRQELRVPHP
ncbi:MAG: GPW/gp25 family protein [Desulfobacter sp.]|nr:MAG: GPW/gp25 family protein [Desulfobacter sp.]